MIIYDQLSKIGAALVANGIEGERVRVILITNTNVKPLYAEIVLQSLKKHFLQTTSFEIPDGEKYKTLKTYLDLINQILATVPDRQTLILALGGGVTTDLAGFVAATLLRGLRWVAIPTSLLAMVDAAVGGKTGVNTKQGKNLVGAFWPPSLVFIDSNVLASLPKRELQCGLGEIVKHSILDQRLFSWLKKHAKELAANNLAAFMQAIKLSLAVKSAIVARDPHENGERALLNLGHTIAHALETVLNFGTLPHGIAVAIGLVLEAKISCHLGFASPDLTKKISELLANLGMPHKLDQKLDKNQFIQAMLGDKKRLGNSIKMPFAYGIGDVRVVAIETAILSAAFSYIWEESSSC